MNEIIPGHAKAITWLLALIALVVTYARTGNWIQVAGALVFIVGIFIADQATHLAQKAHSEPAPTLFERWLQKHKAIAIFAGCLLLVLGLGMLLPAASF